MVPLCGTTGGRPSIHGVIVTPTLVDPIAEAKAEELATPAMVVPFLKKDKFDNELPKYEKKQQ